MVLLHLLGKPSNKMQIADTRTPLSSDVESSNTQQNSTEPV